MELHIRHVAADDTPGIEAYVRLRTSVTPDDADSVESTTWEDATYPGQVFRLMAERDLATFSYSTGHGRYCNDASYCSLPLRPGMSGILPTWPPSTSTASSSATAS